MELFRQKHMDDEVLDESRDRNCMTPVGGDPLKGSDDLFRELADAIPAAVYQFYARENGEMGLSYISRNAREITGLDNSVGGYFERFRACVAPEDREGFLASIMQAVRSCSRWEYEWRFIRPDGEERYLQGASNPKRRGGDIVFNGVVLDVTDRRKAEIALQESEAKYRFLAEKMNDIVWTMDLGLRTTYVSPSITRMLGFTPEERMAQDPKDQLTPESYELCMRMLAQELERDAQEGVDPDRMITMEAEYYHKDGTKRWFENVVSAIRDGSGSVVGLHGVSRDVTERRRVEEALLASERKFSAAFHASPAPMVITDIHQGVIIDANEACAAWSGYNREEVIGRTTIELGFWVQPPARAGFVSHILKDGGMDSFPLTYRVENGEMRDTLHSARIIELEGVPCILSHIQDVTEMRRAQEELLRHRVQLEEMVRSRTRDLSNALEELTREVEARKKIDAALRAREIELRNRGGELEDMNAALKVLLRQRDEDRQAMEMNIVSNIRTLVLPALENLEQSRLDQEQMRSLALVRAQLQYITSPFARIVSLGHLGFTRAEIKVAALIREGKSSKEISRLLDVSLNTVHTYRFNIRTKAGLKNSKQNLRTFLKTLNS